MCGAIFHCLLGGGTKLPIHDTHQSLFSRKKTCISLLDIHLISEGYMTPSKKKKVTKTEAKKKNGEKQ